MEPPLVNQPTKRPTNKLSAAVFATATTQTAGWALAWYLDDSGLLPFALASPLSILGAFLAGYFVQDRKNT